MRLQRALKLAAPLIGILLAALIMVPLLDRNLSPVTSGVMIGVAGVVCLVGIVAGVWNARRGEAKRKAKEQIWINH